MKFFFNEIIKELNKCKKTEDVPVSALIIDKNNRIVSKGSNTRQKNFNFCNHAEINVINNMYRKLKTKNLSSYRLIVSLKPCIMCISVIEQAQINEIYYYLENIKCNYNKYQSGVSFIKIDDKDQEEILKNKLKKFFTKLRR